MIGKLTNNPTMFIGPMEIVVLIAVLAVIVLGSRASDVARKAGKSIGEFNRSKQQIEQEIESVKEEVDEEIGDVKRDVQADIDEVRTEINQTKNELKDPTGVATSAETSPTDSG
jgi:sec-independent protein translocase protein TatA